MTEKLVEEYDIDFNNLENTLKSLRITAVLVLDKERNVVFSFPDEANQSRLFKLANAVLSLLEKFSPWTAIESGNQRIYFYEKNGKIIILETRLSDEEFEELAKIIDSVLEEIMKKG